MKGEKNKVDALKFYLTMAILLAAFAIILYPTIKDIRSGKK